MESGINFGTKRELWNSLEDNILHEIAFKSVLATGRNLPREITKAFRERVLLLPEKVFFKSKVDEQIKDRLSLFKKIPGKHIGVVLNLLTKKGDYSFEEITKAANNKLNTIFTPYAVAVLYFERSVGTFLKEYLWTKEDQIILNNLAMGQCRKSGKIDSQYIAEVIRGRGRDISKNQVDSRIRVLLERISDEEVDGLCKTIKENIGKGINSFYDSAEILNNKYPPFILFLIWQRELEKTTTLPTLNLQEKTKRKRDEEIDSLLQPVLKKISIESPLPNPESNTLESLLSLESSKMSIESLLS